eukprot:4155112-Amphidinium_carterae.1
MSLLSRGIINGGRIHGVLGIHVDDIIAVCLTISLTECVHKSIQEIWVNSDPEVLGRDVTELNFLGVRLGLTSVGDLVIHQAAFASELVAKYRSEFGTRKLVTPREPKTSKSSGAVAVPPSLSSSQASQHQPGLPTEQELKYEQCKLGPAARFTTLARDQKQTR